MPVLGSGNYPRYSGRNRFPHRSISPWLEGLLVLNALDNISYYLTPNDPLYSYYYSSLGNNYGNGYGGNYGSNGFGNQYGSGYGLWNPWYQNPWYTQRPWYQGNGGLGFGARLLGGLLLGGLRRR